MAVAEVAAVVLMRKNKTRDFDSTSKVRVSTTSVADTLFYEVVLEQPHSFANLNFSIPSALEREEMTKIEI